MALGCRFGKIDSCMASNYLLSLRDVNVLAPRGLMSDVSYTCEDAVRGCRPQYVFSVPGQVGFRLVLNHVRVCNTGSCRQLKKQIYVAVEHKLSLLIMDAKLLGCGEAQDLIYNTKKLCLRRKEFPSIAKHLSLCTEERCAQLRRAVLLTIRDQMNEDRYQSSDN